MATEPLTGWPYPSNGDAPAGAAQIMALVNAAAGVSGRSNPVFRVVSTSERDSIYGPTTVPAGIIVASAPQGLIWLKVATGGTSADWKVIYDATAEVSKGFSGSTASWSGTDIYKEVTIDISAAALTTLTAAIPALVAGPSFASSVTAVTAWVVARSTTSVTIGVKANSALASGTVITVLLMVSGTQ